MQHLDFSYPSTAALKHPLKLMLNSSDFNQNGPITFIITITLTWLLRQEDLSFLKSILWSYFKTLVPSETKLGIATSSMKTMENGLMNQKEKLFVIRKPSPSTLPPTKARRNSKTTLTNLTRKFQVHSLLQAKNSISRHIMLNLEFDYNL